MEQKTFDTKFLGQKIRCIYVKDKSTAAEVVRKFMAKDVLFGIDTETAGLASYKHIRTAALSPHLARIRLLQIFDGKNSIVFDMDTIQCNELFVSFLESKRFLAHYAMFDLGMIKKHFGITDMNIGCTQILYKTISHAIYPVDGQAASLEALTDNILGVKLPKMAQRSDWNEPDLTFEQIEYAALDPVAVIKIGEKIAHNLTKFNITSTYNLCKAVQHPLSDMQLNGMLIDVPKHKEKVIEWGEKLWEARCQVLDFTGIEKITDALVAEWLEENLSPEEKALWPMTEGGKDGLNSRMSTSAHAFSEFSYLPIVEPISLYKKLEKLSSSFGQTLLNMINPATGRVHTGFNIAGARTGRLSSSKPNLQQYPSDPELRSHFIPSPGNVFVCADYSQIEVRVAAEVSNDEKMLSIYANGLDIYTATASHLTGIPINEIGKQSRERKIAKALVLGLLFGLGASKFSHYAKKGYGIDVPLEESTKNIEAFRDLYSTFRLWQLQQARRCKDSLYVRTVGGKLRRLAEDSFYGPGLNHPVQGTAAEVIFHALVKLHKDFKGTEVKMINCVHDEIVSECPPEIAEDVAELKKIRMTEAYQELFPAGVIRGLVNVDIGQSWGDAKPS